MTFLTDVESFFDKNWMWVIFATSLLLLAVPLVFSLSGDNLEGEEAIASEKPDVFKDAAFWQWSGLKISEGEKPYQDIFEIKSPMTLLFPALLAYISGPNVLLLHFLSVISTVLAAAGTVTFVGYITFLLTEDKKAAAFASFSVFTYATFLYRASLGFAPKYFVLLFGLLSFICVKKERWFAAGVFSVLSTSFWQFGLIFALIAVAKSFRSFEELKWVSGGMASATFAIFLPLFLTGTFTNMVVSAIISPLSTSGPSISIFNIIWHMKYSVLLFPIVLLGFVCNSSSFIENKSLLAIFLWFGAQLLLLDYDGFIDLITLMPFLGIYAGLSFYFISNCISDYLGNIKKIFGIFLSLSLILSLVGGGLGWFYEEYKPLDSEDGKGIIVERLEKLKEAVTGGKQVNKVSGSGGSKVYDPYNHKLLFWGNIDVEPCYVMRGPQQSKWINKIEKSENATNCGELSSAYQVLG